MQPTLKKILRAVSLDIRHALEGAYDNTGTFHPGDLETRLNALGVWRERPAKALEELTHLSLDDKAARQVIDAYIAYRAEAEISRAEAVAEFVRESAYNWANRLLALRCMEARGIIDEVILQKEIYGGRSLVHNRLARRNPAACAGPDEGLFAVLFQEFEERARELPELFAPTSPAIILRPSLPALKHCLALLSGTEKPSGQDAATDEVFSAPDALGWAYQYWNTEEKGRVFDIVRNKKGAKIEGADIIPATQLYTEPYMVKFLVQNSLGAAWMSMHPDSKLSEGWEYYVKDADRAPYESKAIEEITQLDPACGSGHFHLEAFDLLFRMYKEDHSDWGDTKIAAAILNNNLYGIDIDERAVQIAAAALWMKAREYAPDLQPEALTSFHQHLVATNIRLPNGKDHLKVFLSKHPEAAPLQPALEAIFEGLENVHELGSLVQIEEPVEKELRYLREKYEGAKKRGVQGNLFEPTLVQGELPLGVGSYEQWKANTLIQLEQHFIEESEAADHNQAFFNQSAYKGIAVFSILSKRFSAVIANPPYLGDKKFGSRFKSIIQHQYPSAWKDLFAAFFVRQSQLTYSGGYTSYVVQHGLFTVDKFSKIRQQFLEKLTFEIVAPLGANAFAEISGEVVNVSLCVLRNLAPKASSSVIFIENALSEVNVETKGKALSNSSKYIHEGRKSLLQTKLSKVPSCNIGVYWLPETLLNLLIGEANSLSKIFAVTKGLKTGQDKRFVRFSWECPEFSRWTRYHKGGGFCKWFGNNFWYVDWSSKISRVKIKIDEDVPPEKFTLLVRDERYYDKPSLVFSAMGGRSFGTRYVETGIASDAAQGLIPLQAGADILLYMSMLNSRITTIFARALSGNRMSFDKNYIAPIPLFMPNKASILKEISKKCIELKREIISRRICEFTFNPASINAAGIYDFNSYAFNEEISMLWLDGLIEKYCISSLDLSQDEQEEIIKLTGSPTTWYPIVRGYDGLLINETTNWVREIGLNDLIINETDKRSISVNDLALIKTRLRQYFEIGPDSNQNEFGESDEYSISEFDDDSLIADNTTTNPIPQEFFIERLSAKLAIHPISIYWLLKDGIEQEGWRCHLEEKRFKEDALTVLILRLLGHRWPKQIEAGEPVPEWADKDGIIALTPGLPEPMLLERVRARLPEAFSGGGVATQEREFEEIMGESLEKWVSSSFFKHHISQFKKRPIAWQLSSRSSNGAGGKNKKKGLDKAPAFACLMYYNKLDHNSLTTLQSQYARPLRQSYATELRTLDNNAFLTPDQSSRRLQLEVWIDELKDFETRLDHCAREGFTSPVLTPVAADEPLDRWTSRDGQASHPTNRAEFEAQEMRYDPDLNDGVRVNIAPLQKFGLLAADVLDAKDLEKAIADRAEWRADERRWCREGKLPQPGWWI